jgi:hypothetical protein
LKDNIQFLRFALVVPHSVSFSCSVVCYCSIKPPAPIAAYDLSAFSRQTIIKLVNKIIDIIDAKKESNRHSHIIFAAQK